MGAPLGNQNAAKAKRWTSAIERALERRATGKPPPEDRNALMQGFDAAADIFVSELFEKKDLAYFKEFGDRAEGKPAQGVILSGDEDSPLRITGVTRKIVDPSGMGQP